jgi:thiol-disulfide isomerase/thioredoxin
MKIKLLATVTILSLLLSASNGVAAEKSEASTELQTLITKIQTKLRDGKKTEADLADELKQFDTLLAKHKGEKTDDVAQILFMKASLYEQVFKDKAKGDALMEQLKRDFPDSEPVKMLKQQEAAKKLKGALVAGSKFPDYKGKVVLLDFWATWCGPCVHELPNVIKIYDTYHKQGLEIIGISLDKDQQKLLSFTKEKNMAWPQYFDGLVWQNKLAVKYGVNSIPATYLLDGQGSIIGSDLRGDDLEQAVAKALAKK